MTALEGSDALEAVRRGARGVHVYWRDTDGVGYLLEARGVIAHAGQDWITTEYFDGNKGPTILARNARALERDHLEADA